MPEPRPDLAAIRERPTSLREIAVERLTYFRSRVEPTEDRNTYGDGYRAGLAQLFAALDGHLRDADAKLAALVAHCEELEAALQKIERMAATWLNDPIGDGSKDLLEASRLLIAIRDEALAAAQEEPTP